MPQLLNSIFLLSRRAFAQRGLPTCIS